MKAQSKAGWGQDDAQHGEVQAAVQAVHSRGRAALLVGQGVLAPWIPAQVVLAALSLLQAPRGHNGLLDGGEVHVTPLELKFVIRSAVIFLNLTQRWCTL